MTWDVEFEHVGGILRGSARIEPGLNVIRASNWQGKSSFLQSLETALGVSRPLTEGKESGYVRYDAPDCAGAVRLADAGDLVELSGEPYLHDQYDLARVELFACLGEDNEIRQAVRTGATLTDLMLRPLDFENIEERIRDRRHEREQIDAEIARANQAQKRRPTLAERVEELQSEVSDLRAERDRIRAERSSGNRATTQTELTDAESELARVENQIERRRESVERAEAELAETESQLEDLSVSTDADVESELSAATSRLRELEQDKSILESMYSATELVVNEDRLDLLTDVQHGLDGDTAACWTCGAEASMDDLRTQLDALRARIAEIQSDLEAAQSTVAELEAEVEQAQTARKRAQSLESDADRLREKIASDRQTLEQARERRTELEQRVEDLSTEVSESVAELTTVESEIKYREAELEDTRSDLESMDQRIAKLDDLETERDRVQSRLDELRDRKARIKRETREEFEAAMQDLLERFETGFETARLTPEFEIVVARDGRRASLDALSEGEIELLGFVAALAGYEAFDVGSITPMLLVDRVGGLDEGNLRTLVEYLRHRTDYLVFTAYPAFESLDANTIEPENWAVTDHE